MNAVEWSRYLEERLERPPLIRWRLVGDHQKKPLDEEWTTGPWDEPERWRARLDGWTGGLGMLTGHGLLVIDVDLYKPRAEQSFEALMAETQLSLDTVCVISARGGRHYYFRYDPDIRVPSCELEPFGFPDIDCRADGGFIAIPRDL
jgi:hypothetical protein